MAKRRHLRVVLIGLRGVNNPAALHTDLETILDPRPPL
jgi:hypothetical protein